MEKVKKGLIHVQNCLLFSIETDNEDYYVDHLDVLYKTVSDDTICLKNEAIK